MVVRCRNDVLPHTTSAKYLIVLINEQMAWQPQVDRCISRTARKIGSLWRARRCFTLASRSKYFLSVIMPDLIYGSSAYGSGLTHNQLCLDCLPFISVLLSLFSSAVYFSSSILCSSPLYSRELCTRFAVCLVYLNSHSKCVLQLFSPPSSEFDSPLAFSPPIPLHRIGPPHTLHCHIAQLNHSLPCY